MAVYPKERAIHFPFLSLRAGATVNEWLDVQANQGLKPGRPAWVQGAETGDKDVDCRGQPRRKAAGEPPKHLTSEPERKPQ